MSELETAIGGYVVSLVIIGIPIVHMLGKVGISRWWGILLLLPVVGPWVLLMLLAFARWPAQASLSSASLASNRAVAGVVTAAFLAIGFAAGWQERVDAQPAGGEERCAGTEAPAAAIRACTRDINSGLLDNEDLSIAYSNRGLNFSKSGELAAALNDCGKSIELNSNRSAAYICRGHVLVQIGEYQKAVADFGSAISIDPGRPIAYDGRGMAHLHNGKFDLAIADFDEALRLSPNSVAFRGHRGNAQLGKGAYQEAITDLGVAIAADPRNAKLHFDRGNAWLGLENSGRARDDFEAGLRLDPNNADLVKALARLDDEATVELTPQTLARATLLLLIAAAFLFPLWRIVSRSGRSRWLFAVFLLPVMNLIFLWAFAFMRWPALDAHAAPARDADDARGGIGWGPVYVTAAVAALAAAGAGVWWFVPPETLKSVVANVGASATPGLPDGFYLVLSEVELEADKTAIAVPRLRETDTFEHVAREALVGANHIASAAVAKDSYGGGPFIRLGLTDAGATEMHAATMQHLGRQIAIVVNGSAIAVVTIQSPIEKDVQITGAFSEEEAKAIADRLSR